MYSCNGRPGNSFLQLSNLLYSFCRLSMPGFFKASLTIAQARALLVNFALIALEDLLCPAPTTPRLSMMQAVLLYVSQPTKKIAYTKQTKGYGQAGRKMELEKYHRFIVLGVPGTSAVIAIFTANSEESRIIFRYFEQLKPGSAVTIIKPSLEGQLARGGTALISTREPLIPATTFNQLITLPPYDVEGTSLEFRFFSFVSNHVTVDSAVIADNVCAGKLCDGQTYHEPCGCVETLAKKTWVLLIEFTCPELNQRVNNEDFLTIYSSFTTDFFITQEARKLKSDSDRLDRFRIDTIVQEMVGLVNAGEGFRISGWFKPASDEEGTAVENKNFHVTALHPEGPLTDQQLGKKYRGEAVTSGSGSSVAVVSGLGDLSASSH